MKYLRKYKDYNHERIDEGAKEWILSGLITLASMAGIAQKPENISITKNDVKKAEMVQKKIEMGDSSVMNLFSDAEIELNKQNLESLKKVDIDTEITKIKTPSKKRAKSLIKSGYVVLSVDEIKDTIVTREDKIGTSTIITLNIDSDVAFKTAGYELSEDYKQSLLDTLNYLSSIGDDVIKSIKIESSTDKEPISIGNEKLSKLRSDGVYNDLIDLDISPDIIEVKNLPDQGPDIYKKSMSSEERNTARNKTSEFRYVKIEIEIEYVIKPHVDDIEIIDVIEKYKFELIRPVKKAMKKPKKPGRTKVGKPKIKILKIDKKNGNKIIPKTDCTI